MKITRALLLSSLCQAEAWEYERAGVFSSVRTYRFTATRDENKNIRFQIYCVTQEEYTDDRQQKRTRDKVADEPHVDITFKDAGELINFLRRHLIDFETIWSPVEQP